MRVRQTKLVALTAIAGIGAAQAASLHSYHLKNWGLASSNPNSSIDAPNAWTLEEGSRKVVVGIVDTGLDANHPSLRGNIWHDKSSGSYGWNFVSDKPNPSDDNGHGTHIAGIIGGINDPKNGMSGVAHKVSMMSVKYYADGNSGMVNLRNSISALNYAVDHGAMVINYSGGGPEFSEDEYLALKKAESKGILVVTAAGNEHQDTDLVDNYYYPAAYRLSNIISVASIDINDNLLPSSNWGKTHVDVAAPGENIYSTLPGGQYGYMTGTSQATAFVTGIAVLLLAKSPHLTPTQLKEIILATTDGFPQLKDKVIAGGKVNAYSALMYLNNSPHKRLKLTSTSTLIDSIFKAAGF